MIKAIDLFCGAGGTSTGLLDACRKLGTAVELTAINHWPTAVATHSANHPDARHLCASVDDVNPRSLYKEGELGLLWASPECMSHSNARGGKPINDQSRATAHCVTRWADALRPPVILVENVVEFLRWGDLDGNRKRDAKHQGKTFMAWVSMLKSFGYRVDWRVLCAADYGSPTTRRRLFIQAVRKDSGFRIVWPEPTHAPKEEIDMLGRRQPWRPAREIIDWSIKGASIFDRKKPLKPNTLARIYAGLQKFGLQKFLVQPVHNGSENCRTTSLDEPIGTLPCSNRFALAEPFLIKLRGGSEAHLNSCNSSIEQPVPTSSAGGTHVGLIEPYLIHTNHAGGNRCRSLNDPMPTVTCGNRGEMALIEPFLVKYYATGSSQSVDEPLDTVTTKPRFGLVRPEVTIEGDRYVLDVLFRMLQPHELAAAQGFSPNYEFTGTKEAVVRQIGNAVPPDLAKALVMAVLSQRSDILVLRDGVSTSDPAEAVA
jgi:DNA (cytosine-5)-methyltransferase 1